MNNGQAFIVDTGKTKNINLHLSDTPHTIEVPIKGGLKNISLIETKTATLARVKTNNSNMQKQTLVIEVHSTGSFLLDVDKLTYLGTSLAGHFAWHIFYLISGENNNHTAKRRQPQGDVYTIYKYPLHSKGDTEIEIEGTDVRPLRAGLQHNTLTLWMLLKPSEEEQGLITRIKVRCTEHDAEDDYVLLNTARLNGDGLTKVFYKNDGIVT